jgi:hypothetical protein
MVDRNTPKKSLPSWFYFVAAIVLILLFFPLPKTSIASNSASEPIAHPLPAPKVSDCIDVFSLVADLSTATELSLSKDYSNPEVKVCFDKISLDIVRSSTNGTFITIAGTKTNFSTKKLVLGALASRSLVLGSLYSTNSLPVELHFDNSYTDALASYRKGSHLSAVCTVSVNNKLFDHSRILGYDCSFR